MLASKRIFSAVLVFVPFFFCVYTIQLEYDKTAELLHKALLFAFSLVVSSLAYDSAKHALFMPQKNFDAFLSSLIESCFAFVTIIIFTLIASIIFYYRSIFPFWLGALIYLIALVSTLWFVMAATRAIEVATENGANPSIKRDKQKRVPNVKC